MRWRVCLYGRLRALWRMVLYAPHYLLQFGGSIGTANEEIWSCGIRMYSANFAGFDEEGWFDGVGRSAPSDWMLRPTSHIGGHCRLRFVKFNMIDADGHYADPANTREYVYPTPVIGAGGPSNLPWQCAVVLSWRTDAATRGRASKGRIFSPAPVVGVLGTTGLFAATDAQQMATSAATFLNTLDAGFSTTGTIRPHIMSSVDGSFNEINTVLVDNRVDVLRRRANSVAPATSVAPVLY